VKKPQKSLKDWTDQEWTTKSGKPSTQGAEATGERYLPKKAIEAMSSSEYAATTKKKRKDTAKGKQFSKQPKKAATTARQYRNEGGLMGRDGMKDKKTNGGLAELLQGTTRPAYNQGGLAEVLRQGKAMGGAMHRSAYMEGGESMLVPPEMAAAQEVPEDTYDNIPPEEMDEAMASQLPDKMMVEEHKNYVMSEALEPEELTYLQDALAGDAQLSQIFDKVVTTAAEFTGAGEVEGPGTGVSDSIPARLSDGEFVMTRKATDQIGADNLQSMMDEAERAYDGGLMSRQEPERGKDIQQEMLMSNQMPSVR
jgi:hypothetical protein